MRINVKKIHKDAVIPEFAHDTDSGFDLFTCEDTEVKGKEKGIVKTGLIFELPIGWGFQVRNKSGMTVKGVPVLKKIPYVDSEDSKVYYRYEKIRADVTVYLGTIDSAYRGEVGIMVKNEEEFDIVIPKYTKLAQGVLERVQQCIFKEVEEVNETDRGEGGFGSTGNKKEGK